MDAQKFKAYWARVDAKREADKQKRLAEQYWSLEGIYLECGTGLPSERFIEESEATTLRLKEKDLLHLTGQCKCNESDTSGFDPFRCRLTSRILMPQQIEPTQLHEYPIDLGIGKIFTRVYSNRIYQARRKEKRNKNLWCIACGGKTRAPGRKQCSKCLAKLRDYYERTKHLRKRK